MKRIIFLDTNVFESAKFDYQSKNFINFLEICDERIIDLYITDVVKDEVLKRIHINITQTAS
jgi:predicted nucleic acid-binding protein